ncbi:hypothetical protein IM793_05945 [Pedobacter sp. MR2016-19]|uniref:hypothetical protein n=1 Tax=Pedobacter sp. MR2016-19 TaxID=2780089 RepID=UPI0018757B8C|nr:hypothetical protein [Pedobacter sp. MR2016-19]MBE5318687.1 hypothetical protein [Pedobacter sp. MR2016-19]
MANKIIIIEPDGTPKSPSMNQREAEIYLGGFIYANRIPYLKQSLNDVTNGKKKATGKYTFNGQPVLHASSGKLNVISLSLFFYKKEDDYYIFAMGEHIKHTKTDYKLSDYGQRTGEFKKNATISI